jgi:hypothetical protein
LLISSNKPLAAAGITKKHQGTAAARVAHLAHFQELVKLDGAVAILVVLLAHVQHLNAAAARGEYAAARGKRAAACVTSASKSSNSEQRIPAILLAHVQHLSAAVTRGK